MDDKLDRYLVLKYPKLFVNRYKTPMESCLSFGFECGDGWFWLIDNLCDSIQSYIDNNSKQYRIKNKFFRYTHKFLRDRGLPYKLKNKFLRNIVSKIFDELNRLEREEYETIPQVTVDQVKEKFGTLRFYYSGGDETINGMVWLAEHMSYNICEVCGSTKNIGSTTGWIRTLCEDCATKPNNRGVVPQWKKRKEDPKFLRKLKLDILNQK